MGIIVGLGTFFLWYLIAIIFCRINYLRTSVITASNDLVPVTFTFIVPVVILLTNTFIFLVSLFVLNHYRFSIELFITNIIPGFILLIYFFKRHALILKKQSIREKEELKQLQIENWLNSIKEYNSDLEINFYIYTIEDHLNGTIIAKCTKLETKKALLKSKYLLPDSVKLEIDNTSSNFLQ